MIFDDTPAAVKISKSDALSATFYRPELRFEQQDLTSFSGLVLFQSLFARLGLYRRLANCFRSSVNCPIYPQAKIILLLIVHMLLGFRCLRESRYVAQTGQVLDVLHRSGNVHDSDGAKDFVLECIAAVRAVRDRRTLIEVRMDSAFFSDEILTAFEQAKLRYTISVPFARFLSLKDIIERRIEWQPIDPMRDAFEKHWQPESWGDNRSRRFLFVRQFTAEQRKEPLQLDLFEPVSYCFDFIP